MRIRLHPDALAELRAAGDWYEAQRPGLGAELLLEVDRALEFIARSPSAAPRLSGFSEDREVRCLRLPRFPFLVPYLVQAQDAIILAFAHGRRRPRYWMDRAEED